MTECAHHFNLIWTVLLQGGNLELNVDVTLACQSALFEKGKASRDARYYAAAGHKVFHTLHENAAKALW